MSSTTLPDRDALARPAPHLDRDNRRRMPSFRLWWVIALTVLYTLLGYTFVIVADTLIYDSLARASLASQVLYSRDPSLADIGFVWSPLPTLILLPLVPLVPLWPALLHEGFAANLVSAVCMAAAAAVLLRHAVELGVSRHVRVAVIVAFAVHPMTVMYGANGMSEAMLTLVLVLALRTLHRWVTRHDARQLVGAGTYLGIAYLVRYEAIAAAVAAAALVALVGLWPAHRSAGSASMENRAVRRWSTVSDLALLLFPVGAAFAAWTLFSWVITGSPFVQLSSAYGLAANRVVMGAAINNGETGPSYVGTQLIALAPLLPVALAAVGWAAWRGRDLSALVPLAVLGAPVAFTTLSTASGSTFSLARYYQLVVPLLAAIALWVAAHASKDRRGRNPAGRRRVAGLLGVLLVAPGVVTAVPALSGSWRTAAGARLAPQEWSMLEVLRKGDAAGDVYLGDLRGERRIAEELDQLQLPDGSVLVDTFLGYSIVVRSGHMRQFIVTADNDFADRLADPARYGVRYLLVPDPEGQGVLDAVNRTYPGLFEGRVPFVELAREFPGGVNARAWRLYRVVPPETGGPPEVPAPVPGAKP